MGDPLQGIFGFGGQRIVDWETDVNDYFPELCELTTPYRWLNRNGALGEWLRDARQSLKEHGFPSFESAPVNYIVASIPQQLDYLHSHANRYNNGQTVVICRFPGHCRNFAMRSAGRFQAIEEIAGNDLLNFARQLEGASGFQRAICIIGFAKKCMTVVGGDDGLAPVLKRYQQQQPATPKQRAKHPEVVAALDRIASGDDSLQLACEAMKTIQAMAGARKYRAELWHETLRALSSHSPTHGRSLEETAWHVRNATRHAGRRLPKRTISHTLLIKGLEFDHAIVIDPYKMDYKNFYVAITRGSSSLTVLTQY